MSVGTVGRNGAEEFFETIIFMTAYEEGRKKLQSWTESIDNPILREATESAGQVILFGLVFQLIRAEEKVLEIIWGVAGVAFGWLILRGSSLARSIRSSLPRFGRRKPTQGVSAKNRLPVLYQGGNRDVAIAQVVVEQAGNVVQARRNMTQSSGLYDAYIKTKQTSHSASNVKSQLANSMAQNYIFMSFFKLFTSTFTAQDEVILKKILGRDNLGSLNIEDINKIGSFMFAKDDQGNIVGLSQAFLELLNGLGYLHKG